MTLTKTTLAVTLTILAFQTVEMSVRPTAAAAAQIVGDAARGNEITAKWCVSCHLLDGQSGSDGAPPLRGVSAKGAQTPGFFRNFLMAPHKPMPPLQLTNQEIEDVVAYLGELSGSDK